MQLRVVVESVVVGSVVALLAAACGSAANPPAAGAAADDVAATDGLADGTATPGDGAAAADGMETASELGPADADLEDADGADGPAIDADGAGDGGGVATCGPQPVFDPAANGSAPGSRVGDVVLPTLDGDWSLAQGWTGCDSVVFLFTAPGSKFTAIQAVWKTAPLDLLKASPPNVHYVFGAYEADDATAEATVAAQKARFQQALAKLPGDLADAWAPRLHFVSVVPFSIPGWLGQTLKAKGVFGLAIDRQQTRREVGSLQSLKSLAFEAQRLEYEAAAALAMAADQATVVPLWDKVNGGNGWGPPKVFADVTFPDAAAMAKFDTMTLDIGHACKDASDANCPDWDREAYLNICDLTTESAVAVPMACQTGTDTQTCACSKPDGRTSTGKRACNATGSGYGACECPCDTEFARQITSYKRQGRWLTDLSPLLPLVAKGGKARFRYDTPDAWLVTANVRLSTAGKATRPTSIVPLWHGEQFDAQYNDKFLPLDVPVPKDTKAARLVAIITGHGSATDTENCAEFCPHEHIFSVGGKSFSKAHPLAGTATGCQSQVLTGALPNQYGTWPYGRAGWCPGMDVQVWTADVTAQVQPGQSATFSYKALLGGKPFVPSWTGQGDYKPVIRMSSWVEFEQL